jgi:hypothetical protein
MTPHKSFRWTRGCSPLRSGESQNKAAGGRAPANSRSSRTWVHSRPVLVLPGTRRQDRYPGVVNMQGVAGDDVGSEGVDERLQRCRRRPDPAGQARLQVHPINAADGPLLRWRSRPAYHSSPKLTGIHATSLDPARDATDALIQGAGAAWGQSGGGAGGGVGRGRWGHSGEGPPRVGEALPAA